MRETFWTALSPSIDCSWMANVHDTYIRTAKDADSLQRCF
jgi:hypothetical protein